MSVFVTMAGVVLGQQLGHTETHTSYAKYNAHVHTNTHIEFPIPSAESLVQGLTWCDSSCSDMSPDIQYFKYDHIDFENEKSVCHILFR